MGNEVKIEEIDKLKITSEVVEVKVPGDDLPVKELRTKVQFEYIGGPGKMSPMLHALAAEHNVAVSFASPQLVLAGMEQ